MGNGTITNPLLRTAHSVQRPDIRFCRFNGLPFRLACDLFISRPQSVRL